MGIVLSYTCGTTPLALFSLFFPISGLNMYAAYRMNLAIVTRTLDLDRGDLALHAYCTALVRDKNEKFKKTTRTDGKDEACLAHLIASPYSVSKMEAFIWRRRKDVSTPTYNTTLVLEQEMSGLRLDGTECFSHFTTPCTVEAGVADEAYRFMYANSSRTLYLWYLEHATRRDVLHAFIHASILRAILQEADDDVDFVSVLSRSREIVNGRFEQVVQGLRDVGWDVEYNHLADGDCRILCESE